MAYTSKVATQAIHNQVMQQVAEQVAGEMEKALDEEIEKLDNLTEDDYAILRKKRIAQMKKEAMLKEKWKKEGHGQVLELSEEKEFFDLVKKRCVHFFFFFFVLL